MNYVGYPQPGYQGYPQPGYPPAPQPQVFVTQAPPQAANSGAAEAGLLGWYVLVSTCTTIMQSIKLEYINYNKPIVSKKKKV